MQWAGVRSQEATIKNNTRLIYILVLVLGKGFKTKYIVLGGWVSVENDVFLVSSSFFSADFLDHLE